MSSLGELHKTPVPSSRRAKLVALGVAIGATASMLLGPGAVESYQQSQEIGRKRGPAQAFVAETLGKLILSDHQLSSDIGEHTCTRGVRLMPGDAPRFCSIRGESQYVFAAPIGYNAARKEATDVMDKQQVKQGEYTIRYHQEDISVAVNLSVETGAAHNRWLSDDSSQRVPDQAYVADLSVRAYSLQHTVPQYVGT
jgi:hypothetical protein